MVVVLTKGLWACKYMEETNRSYLLDMQRSPLRDAGLIFLLWHIFGAIFHLFHRQILPFELFSINVGVCTFSKMEWHISLVTDTATTHLPRQLLSVHTLYTLNRPKIRSAKSKPPLLPICKTQTQPKPALARFFAAFAFGSRWVWKEKRQNWLQWTAQQSLVFVSVFVFVSVSVCVFLFFAKDEKADKLKRNWFQSSAQRPPPAIASTLHRSWDRMAIPPSPGLTSTSTLNARTFQVYTKFQANTGQRMV